MNESVMKRIESIEKELSILKQEVQASEKIEVLKPKRFIPNNGEKYYYVAIIGEVVSSTFCDTENLMDRFNVKIRNCFRTKEEAEDHKRFIYIESRLRDLAELERIGEEDLKFYLTYKR